jgi:nicotinamidase/pyrazinamidase
VAEALVIVDVQNDFIPGGALPVPDGDAVIEPLNRLARAYDTVFATRDWHPADHHSFEPEGGPWPVHCVQGTEGAEIHRDVDRAQIDYVVDKGDRREVEGYSAFDGTDFEQRLRERGIDSLALGGLAENICVHHTALEARRLGFEVTLVEDATRGIEVSEGDTARALEGMRAAGVRVVRSDELG